jgi:hypothetical protein
MVGLKHRWETLSMQTCSESAFISTTRTIRRSSITSSLKKDLSYRESQFLSSEVEALAWHGSSDIEPCRQARLPFAAQEAKLGKFAPSLTAGHRAFVDMLPSAVNSYPIKRTR